MTTPCHKENTNVRQRLTDHRPGVGSSTPNWGTPGANAIAAVITCGSTALCHLRRCPRPRCHWIGPHAGVRDIKPMLKNTAHTREARTPSRHLTGTMRLTLRLQGVAAVSIPPDDGVAAAARRRSRRFAWPPCATETFLRRDRIAVTVAPPRQKAGAARPRRSVWRRPVRTHEPELLRCLTERAKSTHPAAVEKT